MKECNKIKAYKKVFTDSEGLTKFPKIIRYTRNMKRFYFSRLGKRSVVTVGMDFFQVNLPTDFLPLINSLNGTNADSKVKLPLAIGLFVEKLMTLSKAAELSG